MYCLLYFSIELNLFNMFHLLSPRVTALRLSSIAAVCLGWMTDWMIRKGTLILELLVRLSVRRIIILIGKECIADSLGPGRNQDFDGE